MDFVTGPRTVRTPATSANLGPGFDALAIALTLADEVTASVAPDGLHVEAAGAGADEVPLDETHLVVRSMRAGFDLLGGQPPGLRVACRNAIPHGRGLGSSAAAIVGGLVLARALVEGGADVLDEDTLLAAAGRVEGHPDNVAAALLGGLTVAWTDGSGARAVRLDASAEVVVFVPPEAVATRTARGLLPDTVTHPDAARNAGRAALLVAALSGRPDVLLAATEDRLHQDARGGAMPDSHDLIGRLRAAGVAAVLSGAGPAVLAFTQDASTDDLVAQVPASWEAHRLAIDPRGAHVGSEPGGAAGRE